MKGSGFRGAQAFRLKAAGSRLVAEAGGESAQAELIVHFQRCTRWLYKALSRRPFDVWLLMKREEEIATEYGHKAGCWSRFGVQGCKPYRI